eukprot:CAMPEP_0114115168 /NCGR_PEP_ID=MMETSP0043_2-20121206/3827_1 /TAXON_ID=464988 /ORGANISM="Hemiselmis andersenii, Strain CCMP644" /LENGTH=97 /DNA_ID=CAMNT_0001207417 /DNA_START=17 /DNA_END=307 /DNA_ORIENTATION=-
MRLFRRKDAEPLTKKEEWEDFKIGDFVDADKAGPAGVDKEGAKEGQLQGMSSHPDNQDVSFEQLMKQYRDYEKEQKKANRPEGEEDEESEEEEEEEE